MKKKKWLAVLMLLLMGMLFGAKHYRKIVTVPVQFAESTKTLHNPNRGFYYIFGFQLQDGKAPYREEFVDKEEGYPRTELLMIEINLRQYANRDLTDAGLSNLRELFSVLREADRQYLIRFLYDWDGKNMETEPQSLQQIERHLRQVGPIVRENADIIYSLQGLFVGNWGELHDSKFVDAASLQTLWQTLSEAVGDEVYLAVRTPAQWRTLTKTADPMEMEAEPMGKAGRLGLFNDGMLGNAQDYGTYGTTPKAEAKWTESWNRADELEFQEALCRLVPNGGEVIHDNAENDFEAAVEALRTMHVSYLNEDYDRRVLEKWEASTVNEPGCYQGENGLKYMADHLGYRLYLDAVQLKASRIKQEVQVTASVKNCGFAPIYKDCRTELVLRNAKEEISRVDAAHHLQELTGGMNAAQSDSIQSTFEVQSLESGTYELYLSITDTASGDRIELGNTAEPTDYGYLLGTIAVK